MADIDMLKSRQRMSVGLLDCRVLKYTIVPPSTTHRRGLGLMQSDGFPRHTVRQKDRGTSDQPTVPIGDGSVNSNSLEVVCQRGSPRAFARVNQLKLFISSLCT